MFIYGEGLPTKYPESHVLSARARAHTAYHVERMLQSYSGAMATIKVNVCRFCGNTVLPKLSIALFTKDGLDRDLPGSVLDRPL